MTSATEWCVHAQVLLFTIRVLCFIIIASEEWIEEVSGEGLSAHLIVAPIQVNRLLQTKRMNSFQAFPFDFDLLRVREVAQGHPTVIKSITALLLFGAQSVEV